MFTWFSIVIRLENNYNQFIIFKYLGDIFPVDLHDFTTARRIFRDHVQLKCRFAKLQPKRLNPINYNL